MEPKQNRNQVVIIVAAMTTLALFFTIGYAGNLEPGAPPGPTMKTLTEVEPRVPICQTDIPLTITNSGSYYLTSDVNSAGTAITVEVNDVTIDLMGYTLVGLPAEDSSGIYANGRTNIEVRNGTIRGFDQYGLYEADAAGKGHRAVNIRLVSNGLHGIRLDGPGHLIKDCTAIANGSTGLHAGLDSTLTGNTAYNNKGHGIYADDGSTVTTNTAGHNQCSGIYLGDGSTATGNTTFYNNWSGIYADEGCMILGNTARQNNQFNSSGFAGIAVFSDCLVKGNSATTNKQHNIAVMGPDNIVEENLVTDSTDNGIALATAGNFYANNRASGNVYDYNDVGGNTNGGGNVSF